MTQHDAGATPIKPSHWFLRLGHIQSSLKSLTPFPLNSTIQITAVSLQTDVPQRLQSHCFVCQTVPCLTSSTAWCLYYITKDIETNHTTHTVHSTNIRITENPQQKKKNPLPNWTYTMCTSFSFIYRETSYKSINTYEWMPNTLQQYQIQETFQSSGGF